MTDNEICEGLEVTIKNIEALQKQLEPFNKSEGDWLLPVGNLIQNSKNNQETLRIVWYVLNNLILNHKKLKNDKI